MSMVDEESQGSSSPRKILLTRWILRGIALIFAVVQSYAVRNSINSDGRSYLEVAQAYLRHDWAMAVNSYWSPLYSWMLAPLLHFTKPSLRQIYPFAHLLNLGVFVVSTVAFEFFWSELLATRRAVRVDRGEGAVDVSQSALWILGYIPFIWLIAGLLPFVNPDLTLSIFVLGAAGILLQILGATDAPSRIYVSLGLLLGFGYLAKAVMFPMAFVFLTVLLLHRRSRNFWKTALAFVVFLGIASPEIAWLSSSKGYLTFSGTGKLAYAWTNYDLPLLHWQGQPAGSGVPAHSTRKVYAHPNVFEFNGPIRSSYPPWYDPSYWNEGMAPHFQLAVVTKHFLVQLRASLVFLCSPRAFMLGVIVLVLLADFRTSALYLVFYWPLGLIMSAIIVLYSATVSLPRYLAPWQMLLWGAILCSIQLRKRFCGYNIFWWVAVGVAFLSLGSQAKWIHWQLDNVREDDAVKECAAAEGLHKVGLKTGDNVGSIGFDEVAQWAYLGGFSIVAEINSWDACEFWHSPTEVRAEVLDKFKQSGAKAVVANTGGGMMIRTKSGEPPIDQSACAQPGDGWRKIEGSANHVYLFNRNE